MLKATYFDIEELVPIHVYADRGEKAWRLLDDRLIITLDALNERYGPMTINDWKWGGGNQWRGLRTEQSPVGSKYSTHRLGKTADVTFSNTTAEAVRAEILADPLLFPLITELETDISWFHVACGTNVTPILTYKP